MARKKVQEKGWYRRRTILTVNITRGSKILVLMDENASCLLKLLLFIVFSAYVGRTKGRRTRKVFLSLLLKKKGKVGRKERGLNFPFLDLG